MIQADLGSDVEFYPLRTWQTWVKYLTWSQFLQFEVGDNDACLMELFGDPNRWDEYTA